MVEVTGDIYWDSRWYMPRFLFIAEENSFETVVYTNRGKLGVSKIQKSWNKNYIIENFVGW